VPILIPHSWKRPIEKTAPQVKGRIPEIDQNPPKIRKSTKIRICTSLRFFDYRKNGATGEGQDSGNRPKSTENPEIDQNPDLHVSAIFRLGVSMNGE